MEKEEKVLIDGELSRVNFRISKRLKRYFERKSKESGVSQSALMALALEEYVYQKEVVDFMGKFDTTLEKIEEFNKMHSDTL